MSISEQLVELWGQDLSRNRQSPGEPDFEEGIEALARLEQSEAHEAMMKAQARQQEETKALKETLRNEVEWPAEESFEEFGDVPNNVEGIHRDRQIGALGPTWWLIGDEHPLLSDLYERSGNSLDRTFDFFKVYPITIDETRKIFGARFEFPQAQKGFIYGAEVKGAAVGLIDFLTGFPMASTEMLVVMGQYSSRLEHVDAYRDPGSPIPPIPDDFFEGYESDKKLLNYLYIDEEWAETLADPLSGEADSEGLHWWLRINVEGKVKYPIPGEFLALINRPWCVLPWGEQESSPYIFSGEWMDTVYLTGAVVREKIELENWTEYIIEWRRHRKQVRPTDFATYNVGDFVTILKTLPNAKNSQLWKDADMKEFGDDWVIAPLMFYGFDGIGVG